MKKWIFALTITFGVAIPAAVAEEGAFKDVPTDFWAADAIYDLKEAEVIEGTPSDNYEPHQAVQRDEAAQILAKALALKPDNAFTPAFLDIQPGDFAFDKVAALAGLGIFSNSETFSPNEPLTREVAAAIIAEGFGLESPAETPVFTDVPKSYWAHGYIQTVAGLGILEGASEDQFNPEGEVSRAYFAVVIDRAMDYKASQQEEPAQPEEVPAETPAPIEDTSAEPPVTEAPPAEEQPAEEAPPAEPVEETPAPAVEPVPEIAEEAAPAPPATSDQAGLSADEQRSMELVNLERSKTGAAAVVADSELNRIAQVKAEDMAVNHYFDHTSPTYGSPFEMAYDFGYSYLTYGENLAIGYTTPGSVMSGWMASDSHRMNLLNPGYTHMGVGHVTDSEGTDYWVHLFSSK